MESKLKTTPLDMYLKIFKAKNSIKRLFPKIKQEAKKFTEDQATRKSSQIIINYLNLDICQRIMKLPTTKLWLKGAWSPLART